MVYNTSLKESANKILANPAGITEKDRDNAFTSLSEFIELNKKEMYELDHKCDENITNLKTASKKLDKQAIKLVLMLFAYAIALMSLVYLVCFTITKNVYASILAAIISIGSIIIIYKNIVKSNSKYAKQMFDFDVDEYDKDSERYKSSIKNNDADVNNKFVKYSDIMCKVAEEIESDILSNNNNIFVKIFKPILTQYCFVAASFQPYTIYKRTNSSISLTYKALSNMYNELDKLFSSTVVTNNDCYNFIIKYGSLDYVNYLANNVVIFDNKTTYKGIITAMLDKLTQYENDNIAKGLHLIIAQLIVNNCMKRLEML